MKTIKNLKDITTLEVGDVVIFGDLEYIVRQTSMPLHYYLYVPNAENDQIFKNLHIDIQNFINKLGIICDYNKTYFFFGAFPECYSLEALTALVSALFKEYEKQNELPKTWEEFCERNKNIQVFKLTTGSSINIDFLAYSSMDKNTCHSRQEAEAFLALMQLRQLRKAYVKDWEPDWTKTDDTKYCIDFYEGRIRLANWNITSQVLSFPNHELAEQFLTNFKDLIEIAKPLL